MGEISVSSRGTLASEFGKSVIQLQLPESPPQLRCGWAPSEGNTVFRLEHTALRFCDCGGAGEQLPAAGYVFTYRFAN